MSRLSGVTINGTPQKTPAQVLSMVAVDGELAQPTGITNAFYAKARLIRRDPTVKLARWFAVAPLVGSSWSYECEDYAPEGAKDFIAEQMERVRLQLLTSSLYGCIDFGWQPYEILYEDTPEGFWGFKSLKPLLQDITTILVMESTGDFVGLRQEPYVRINSAPLHPIDLFENECCVINLDVEGTNWYGEPILKSIESIYDEAQLIHKNARKYDAKVAGTHWVIYYPLGVSQYAGAEIDNGEIARKLLASIESVGGIAVPRSVVQVMDALNEKLAGSESTQWKVELLTDNGSGTTSFAERFRYLDTLKVRAFGFPERALLEGQFGTKAEAEAHADLAILNMEMRHKALVEQYNEKLVNLLLRLNYGPDAECSVYIQSAPLADRALAFLRDIYKLLMQNPQSGVEELMAMDRSAIRDRLGIPVMSMQDMYGDAATDQAMLDEYGNPIMQPDADMQVVTDSAPVEPTNVNY